MRAKHSNTSDPNNIYYGVNGITGKVENMKTLNVWDTLSVKKQTLKTAVESACMILRIDDIVSGGKKRGEKKEINPSQEAQIDNETVNKYFRFLNIFNFFNFLTPFSSVMLETVKLIFRRTYKIMFLF